MNVIIDIGIIVLVLILYFFFIKRRVELIKKAIKEDKDLFTICVSLYLLLSFQWKFFEELVGELLRDQDEVVKEATDRFLVGQPVNGYRTVVLKRRFIAFFEDSIEVDTVFYSRMNKGTEPFLFRSLPEWKKKECEDFLKRFENLKDDDEVPLDLKSKLQDEGHIVHEGFKVVNLGVALFRIKMKNRGNSYRKPEENPEKVNNHPWAFT